MRLVSNWKQAHRWYSTQAPALAVALLLTWQTLPEDIRSQAPDWLKISVLVILLLGGIAGRLIDQPPPVKPDAL